MYWTVTTTTITFCPHQDFFTCFLSLWVRVLHSIFVLFEHFSCIITHPELSVLGTPCFSSNVFFEFPDFFPMRGQYFFSLHFLSFNFETYAFNCCSVLLFFLSFRCLISDFWVFHYLSSLLHLGWNPIKFQARFCVSTLCVKKKELGWKFRCEGHQCFHASMSYIVLINLPLWSRHTADRGTLEQTWTHSEWLCVSPNVNLIAPLVNAITWIFAILSPLWHSKQ